MKLLIEEYAYPVDIVKDLFSNFDEFNPVGRKVKISCVGYFYHAAKGETVFILPKVVLNQQDKVFNDLKPEDIYDLSDENNPLNKPERQKERNFIYGFSAWVYRAIAVFRQANPQSEIIRHQKVVKQGRGRRKTANTYLDILLSLIDFAKQNRDWLTFIIRNLHLGYNHINWSKTINKSQVFIQDDTPVYLDPVTKNRRINLDEELLVIFYSILTFIHKKFGFPVEINLNYPLITGKKFQHYIEGFGIKRLRQIKHKYFSDKALQLWDLCFAFFEQSTQISMASPMNEYLLAKNFNIVFEAMIDELIGEKELPDRLNKKQEDGKKVDHLFLWDSLIHNHTEGKKKAKTYYIGDSKYYKQKNSIGRESVAKQFTYARNVIQWNINLFHGTDEDKADKRETDFCLRDELTEGYNIIPNFFISGTIPESLEYSDNIEASNRNANAYVSHQFCNRLFDRDTLLVVHYDINFLFIISLYARNNAPAKQKWRDKVRNILHDKIHAELESRYTFFALRPKEGIVAKDWIEAHFKAVIGKVFSTNGDVIILALRNKPQFDKTNTDILALLDTAFHRVILPN